MFVRSAYNYDADVDSHQSGVNFSLPSRAQQHFKDECDINVLVRQFINGRPIEAPASWPTPPDFDEVFDFQSAMNVIRAGTEAFASLPAEVRKRFSNDPGEYLAFVNDPANLQESEKLGLVPRGTYDSLAKNDVSSSENPSSGVDNDKETD